jgi:cytochrome c553
MNLRRYSKWIALVAAGLYSATAFASDYIDMRRIEPVTGDAKAAESTAVLLCASCHGASGVGVVPMFPDLAGQKPDYLYHQLLRFKSGVLPESPMTALMANISEEDLRNFAVYYAALPAGEHPAEVNDAARFERGAVLFSQGDSAAGIPPCQGCHGVGGRGLQGDAYRAYPILRHQKTDYLITRLKDYRSGKLNTTSNDFVMQAVAHRLDDEAIADIAAWLASAP